MKLLHLNLFVCTLKWVPVMFENYMNWTLSVILFWSNKCSALESNSVTR
jgi:hypothetical protein